MGRPLKYERYPHSEWINGLRVGDEVQFTVDGDIGVIVEIMKTPRGPGFRSFLVKWPNGAETFPRNACLQPVDIDFMAERAAQAPGGGRPCGS